MGLRAPDPREEIVAYLPQLRAFAQTLTRNPASADDLVQDTMVKAWKSFHTFTQGTNLKAWLFTILRNTYLADLRKARRRPILAVTPFSDDIAVTHGTDTQIAMIDFERALATSPEPQREAIVLVGPAGLSYQEAANSCGVSIGTIKSRVNRGRARLAELLELTAADRAERG